jgi:NADP-dependent 3-hydroxy acid dehydrogenase YdfG
VRLPKRGAEPVLPGHNPHKLTAAKAELESGKPLRTRTLDLYDEQKVDALIQQLKSEHRHIK